VSEHGAGGTVRDGGGAGPAMRLDRWLWCARFFKSRSLAARLCAASRVRVNSRVVSKASAAVRVGDVLTFPQGQAIRVIRVDALADRRGPASEARLLFEDLDPPVPRGAGADIATAAPPAMRDTGAGRPTKADRRALDRFRGQAG